MTIRTTVAFDPGTVSRWERLARRWGVSKSEALRRALEIAEAGPIAAAAAASPVAELPSAKVIAGMSAADALAWLESHSLVAPEEGECWRGQVAQTRDDFGSRP